VIPGIFIGVLQDLPGIQRQWLASEVSLQNSCRRVALFLANLSTGEGRSLSTSMFSIGFFGLSTSCGWVHGAQPFSQAANTEGSLFRMHVDRSQQSLVDVKGVLP